MIVPVQCEYLSLRGLVQLENTLSMIRENLNPDVEIQGILPTMFDRRTLHSREAVEILQENFGDLVFNTKIRKTVRYAEAPVKGQSVLGYEPERRGGRSCTATSRRRCSMARKRASMREGPLAELFRATEAAQRQARSRRKRRPRSRSEATVEHVPTWEDEIDTPAPPRPEPVPEPFAAGARADAEAAGPGPDT